MNRSDIATVCIGRGGAAVVLAGESLRKVVTVLPFTAAANRTSNEATTRHSAAIGLDNLGSTIKLSNMYAIYFFISYLISN